jgi:hypothetical protein
MTSQNIGVVFGRKSAPERSGDKLTDSDIDAICGPWTRIW